jgi:hypothetical protein
MNKILIIKAIEKAKTKKRKEGKTKPSLTDSSEELSNYIEDNEGFQLNERTYRDYYNEAKKLEGKDEDINIKQLSVINGLCSYLEFDSYQDFTKSLKDVGKKSIFEQIKIIIKKNKVVISILLIIIIGIVSYNYITRQRWMVWDENQYIEVKFDLDRYDVNQIKIYKDDRIDFFKKVITDCNTNFFSEDGTVQIWYGKNKNKELEYFTSFGLHPETGITLKPITQYMISKYICNSLQ